MKPAIFALSLALLGAPTLASAQPAPPPDQSQGAGPVEGHTRNPQFAQMHAQMRALMQQTRAAELSALSPAHKQLLANLAGQLALSASPNFKAAAATLDRALSASESSAILQADQNFRTQASAMHQAMMAARPPSDDAQAGGPQAGGPPRMGNHEAKQRTAGQLLLEPPHGGHGPL